MFLDHRNAIVRICETRSFAVKILKLRLIANVPRLLEIRPLKTTELLRTLGEFSSHAENMTCNKKSHVCLLIAQKYRTENALTYVQDYY